MEWFKIPDSDIPKNEGGINKSRIGGKLLCVIRQGDQIRVMGLKCPHAGADLSGGWCEDGQLVCPYHRHKFDLSTGRGAAGQGNYVRVYPTQQGNDGWRVGVGKGWWKRLFG